MTAPTTSRRWFLARAAIRTTGMLHIVSQRDTGALNPICGANPIRSRQIQTHEQMPTGPDAPALCDDCASIAEQGRVGFLSDTLTDSFRLSDIALDRIQPVAARLRHGPDEALADLAESIRLHGVLQPVLLRHTAAGLEVVAGARRIAAALLAGYTTIPALVRDLTDTDAALAALTENIHRQNLNPIELAHAYTAALDLLKCSKAELGRRLGISREQVSNTIRLLDLPAEDQDRIAAGTLTAQGGRALLAKPRPQAEQLVDIAALLAATLDAHVRVTHTADRARVTIDLPQHDLARLLHQLNAQVTA